MASSLVGTKLSNMSGRAFYYTNLRANDDARKWQALRCSREADLCVVDTIVDSKAELNPASQSARCERCVEGGTAFTALAHCEKWGFCSPAGTSCLSSRVASITWLAFLEERLGRDCKARFWEDRSYDPPPSRVMPGA